MEKKKIAAASSSSSFDHIFGPKVTSSSSSPTTGLFKSIFPPPSAGMLGRPVDFGSQGGRVKYQSPNERGERNNKKEKKSYYNEEREPPCHLSSSIYYGGQEKYSSTTTTTQDTYKKEGEEGDSKSASRETGGKDRFITNKILVYEQLLRRLYKRKDGVILV